MLCHSNTPSVNIRDLSSNVSRLLLAHETATALNELPLREGRNDPSVLCKHILLNTCLNMFVTLVRGSTNPDKLDSRQYPRRIFSSWGIQHSDILGRSVVIDSLM
jgi:hypothetical protein